MVCPVGNDIAYMIRKMREGMAASGHAPEGLIGATKRAVTIGSPMGVKLPALQAQIRHAEKESGLVIPVDVEGADYLLLLSSMEIMNFPEFISAVAKIFKHANVTWTISSEAFEATNSGIQIGVSEIAAELVERVVAAATKLKVKHVISPECGHAYMAIRWEGPNLIGRPYNFRVVHILELLDELRQQGRLRTTGTETQVDLGLQHVTGEIQLNPDDNFTAVEVRGDKPETTLSELETGGGGLDAGWDAGLEGTHDQARSWKNKDSGTVLSSSGTGDAITMAPDAPFSMDAHEWYLGLLRFTSGPESGNGYRVSDNTALQFDMQGPWRAGGPNAGDTFEVEGDAKNGGRDNGHRILGRLFTLSDPTRGIPEDACAKITFKFGKTEIQTQAVTRTPDDPSRPAEVETDLPAIGLIN